ncbi:MAG: DDE-type integrase/transposase/recombinase [Rhizobiales bacterium]|nr:DDE-type integrase/transposase/recombinase [Hyphomicrobiales bacterium]
MTEVKINGKPVRGVADSASSYSFMHPACSKSLNLKVFPAHDRISMASKSLTTEVTGYCIVTLKVKDEEYDNFKFLILPNLCTNLILGLDFLCLHESITLKYGGSQPPLTVCGLSTLKVNPPSLFSNLTPNCIPVRDRSRHYSQEDREFIKNEVERLLKEEIIEESKSPWRAQVVVVKKAEKKRLAIDYSQTINLYTQLDAYPLPRIPDMVNEIAKYRVFSTIDLKSAYHQLPINPEDKPYTAFEANGRLYQFLRMPFGVTNGVSAFQRAMDYMVDKYSLKATYPYLDNVTICGKDQADHDLNLARFREAASQLNLTYNQGKCTFNTSKLSILGCVIENGELRPDPERMRPLMQLPPPHDVKSLKRCLGFFSYYSPWISNFSEKIRPLTKSTTFPISEEAKEALRKLKEGVKQSVVCCIDETIPFQVECDASEFALAATLNQRGQPVAFFSRTLQGPELQHPSVEKEAMAIIEAVRHWRHFLSTRHFTLLTDQKSVSFMFDTKHQKKVKNDKILRWRLELSTFNYTIKYRPGHLNESPDALSRVCALSTGIDLQVLHEDLCHPGVTRLNHFVRSRNLAFSVEEVRAVTRSCPVCAECKPQFYKPTEPVHLIKSTQPFERLNVDFKGPLPSNNRNRFFLHIIDEWSRFPFVFPCPDVSASTVIKCFCQLFSLFGMPSYVHSDRGSAFLSGQLRQFLSSRGIASSRTTSYNPEGNGQIEKENSTVWKAITLSLKSKNLPISSWQDVLPDVLHATRSLLCTATNVTPHERLFQYPRKSTAGVSLPTWLTHPGPVLLKCHARDRKTDPLVEPVELLHANPHYAFIKYPDGREKTVSLKDLAPAGESESDRSDKVNNSQPDQMIGGTPPLISDSPSVDGAGEHSETLIHVASPPKMGDNGSFWCNIDSRNIIEGGRRRHT